MDLVELELKTSYRLLNHGPVVLVSTTDGQVANACAVAWCAPAARDPARFVCTIGKRHKTYQNLKANRECVLNLPCAQALEQVMICGKQSGNQGDKLTPAGIEVYPSKLISAPRLSCCAAWIECKLAAEPEVEGTSLVVLEGVLAEAEPGLMTPEGFVDVEKFETLHHLGSDRFALPGKIKIHASS